MKKIPAPILNAAWGAVLGCVSAWVVWMLIYGIGARVISDAQHCELADSVHLGGTIVGGALGFAVGAACRRPPLVLFAAHFAAGALFTGYCLFSECYGILRMASWRSGLALHWFMLITVCAVLVWAFRKRDEPKEAAARTWGLSRPVWVLIAVFCAFVGCAGWFATGGPISGWGDLASILVLAALGLVAVINAIRPVRESG